MSTSTRTTRRLLYPFQPSLSQWNSDRARNFPPGGTAAITVRAAATRSAQYKNNLQAGVAILMHATTSVCTLFKCQLTLLRTNALHATIAAAVLQRRARECSKNLQLRLLAIAAASLTRHHGISDRHHEIWFSFDNNDTGFWLYLL